MSEATDTAAATETAAAATEQQQEQGKTFSQAEVDAIIRDRLKQQERTKFGDYQDLKTRAEGAKTLEERLGSLEQELSTTKAHALRTSIAARFGISTEKGKDGEPSDADLFLTGTGEDVLIAQAQRLAARQVDSKKQGNVAPREGDTKSTGKPEEQATKQFLAQLHESADN